MLVVGLAAAFAADRWHAAATSVRATAVSPARGAQVNPNFIATAHVRSRRGPYTLAYYLDGKLAARVRGGKTLGAIRSAPLNAPAAGRHTLRVVATSGGHSDAGATTVTVRAPGSTTPDPPAGATKYKLIFFENFSKPAARGTMGSDSDPLKVVYTGANGTKWRTYPRSYLDTYDKRPYRSDQVLSVHDGVLDFFLHPVDGRPAGANPSPLISGPDQYATYGRFSARMKVQNTDLSEYHIAWLLWPKQNGDWRRAESDFPEQDLTPQWDGAIANAFYGNGQVESFKDPGFDIHQWHTYTQDWTPTTRSYWVDGKLIGTTKNPVYDGPERWQLQVETKGDGSHRGHVLVDWVAAYAAA